MKFKKWNKKGEDGGEIGEKLLIAICAVVILSLAGVGYATLMASVQSSETLVNPHVEEVLGSYRFLNSPECFTAQDASGRTMARTIDLDKFTQERMESCFIVSEQSRKNCFSLDIVYLGDVAPATPEVHTQNWVNCYVTADAAKIEKEYVLIKKGDEIRPGMLHIKTKVP